MTRLLRPADRVHPACFFCSPGRGSLIKDGKHRGPFFLGGGFLMYITGGTRLKMDSDRSLSSLKHLKVRPSQAGGNSKLVACCSHETALFFVFVFLQVSHGHSKAACLNLPVECGNPFLRCWSRCARNRATIS